MKTLLVFAIAAILVIVPQCVLMRDTFAAVTPAAFLEVGMGGRPMAMGGAYVALVNDASAIIWNPAALSGSNSRQAVFAYTNQLGLIPYRFAAYSQPFMGGLTVGGGITSSGDDVLSENTIYASVAGPANVGLTSFLGDLSVGGTLKIRNASFGKNSDGGIDRVTGDAFGYGLDIGCLLKAAQGVKIGLLFRDATAPVEWNSSTSGKYNENVPSTFVIGAGLEKGRLLNISVDVENYERVRAGMETTILGIVALRGGYFQTIEAGARKNYSAGIGLTQKLKNGVGFSLDLAYTFHELGNSTRGSFGIGF